ncbi:MAG: hypothetical protein JSV54_05885 [Chloroflexota bacterium]|nr:MAG: hypothetical protein JSV54_05885 [Chloroflexota bacterium]
MKINIDLLKKFESGLDPSHPETSKIPAKVLGYGEISTVFEIEDEPNLACKRMPIFRHQEELDQYKIIYNEYNRILNDKVGINVPPFGFASFDCERYIVCFDVQEKLPPQLFGNKLIHTLDDDDIVTFLHQILKQLKKVWDFNKKGTDIQIGIDGQISNWAIRDFSPNSPRIDSQTRLYYIDTSTPFIRKNGVEQLDPELFLRSAPSFLVWLIRWLFLKDVMTRYYDFHLVAVDLIANFYKEQRPELIPGLVHVANDFFAKEAKGLDIKPLTVEEIRSYYKEDALIWTIFLAMRRLDRFIHKWILRKPYIYILPGKIKR